MESNKLYTRRRFVGTTIGALVAANLAACGGGGSAPPATPPAPAPDAPQTINLSANASRIVGAKPVTLTATLGRGADVTWALGAGSPGTLSATSGTSVTYTPPATAVGAATPVAITATSAGVTATAKLALVPDPRQASGLAFLAGGLGGNGLIDGQGTAARFNSIDAIDADSHGNVVLADRKYTADGGWVSVIRVVGPSGNVQTVTPLATLGYGSADGPLASAQLGSIISFAFASNGDIYFVDYNTDSERRLRVLRGGQITTLQRNFAAYWLVVDRNGNVYAYSSKRVLRVAAGGATATVLAGGADDDAAGGHVDGQGAAARFSGIAGAIAGADGNLYVIDDSTVRKVSPAGMVTTVAGVYGAAQVSVDGIGAAARFGELLSLSQDNNGYLLVLDQLRDDAGNLTYSVRQVTPENGSVGTIYQGEAPPSVGLARLTDSTTHVNGLFFNPATRTIQLVRTAQIDELKGGALQPYAGFEGDSYQEIDGPGTTARFVRLSHLGADLAGNVYTLDFAGPFGARHDEGPYGLWLRKIAIDGTVSTVAADKSFAFTPNAIAADADGNLFLSARQPRNSLRPPYGGALYKVTPGGAVTLFAGSAVADWTASTTSTDGTAGAATFVSPLLEGIDVGGNLYVSDSGKIRKVTPQAVVTTVAALPAGLKAAPNGLSYTVDPALHVIYATDAAGNKTVVAGVAGMPGTRLGALPGGLEAPRDIVPTGPNSFAVISGAAVLRLLLPPATPA